MYRDWAAEPAEDLIRTRTTLLGRTLFEALRNWPSEPENSNGASRLPFELVDVVRLKSVEQSVIAQPWQTQLAVLWMDPIGRQFEVVLLLDATTVNLARGGLDSLLH